MNNSQAKIQIFLVATGRLPSQETDKLDQKVALDFINIVKQKNLKSEEYLLDLAKDIVLYYPYDNLTDYIQDPGGFLNRVKVQLKKRKS